MSASAALDDLQTRIAALQDIEAIESLKARYWRAVDRKRPDDVAACLAADAIIDFQGLPRYENRDAFMELVRQAAANANAFNMHHGQNPRITLTGADSAAGEWDIFYFGIDAAAGTLVQMAGMYNDTYIRQAGEWRILSTQMRQTSLHMQTTAPLLRTVTLGRDNA